MNKITELIEEIIGQKLESRKLEIEENLFLVYTYVCIDSNYWNKDKDFESIENEFVKLAEVKKSDINVNVDYDKLSMLANSSYMKMRINNRCAAIICSSTDSVNYTKLPEVYENQYLYTYIIAMHQRYYLKKLNKEFETKSAVTLKRFIKFINNIWITELTTDAFGQKIYKRCKEKFNLEEIFNQVKSKYDIFYKKLNIEKNKKSNIIVILLLIMCLLVGGANLCSWLFLK